MTTASEEIEKIRSVRRKIAESFSNDPFRIIQHYIERSQTGSQSAPSCPPIPPRKISGPVAPKSL